MVSSYPMKKNTAVRILFPILDADGDPVGGGAGLDSEYSIDGGNFADCTNEATNITSGGSNTGAYYLDLVAGETNGDWICIKVYSSTAGAKTTILVYTTAAQTLDETDAIVDSIVADTNELQTDWVNGGRLDLLVDSTISKIDAVDDYVDTEVAAIKTAVDNILRIGKNRWKISAVANTLTIYADDKLTPLYVLDLKDSAGNAASTNVFERTPV